MQQQQQRGGGVHHHVKHVERLRQRARAQQPPLLHEVRLRARGPGRDEQGDGERGEQDSVLSSEPAGDVVGLGVG